MWEGLEPIEGDLKLLECPVATEITGMEKDVARGDREDVRVGVGDADETSPARAWMTGRVGDIIPVVDYRRLRLGGLREGH